MADYYSLLGISRDADAEEIKKAYRRLALQHHPDRNQGSKEAEARFKEITQAYEVLRDPDKRAVYDRYGEQGLKGQPGAGFGGGFDFSDAIEVFMRDFGGFGGFGDLFGQRSRGGRVRKGQSLKVRLKIGLGEVVSGATKTLRVKVLDTCEACEGSGAETGSSPTPCGQCGGSGEERVVHNSLMGQMVSVQPCRRCHGEGRIVESPCHRCNGDGRVRIEKEVEVEVPPGVTSENYITLRGKGHAAPQGGRPGDLVVLLEVEEDERFIRDGANLLYELPVTFGQAALGDEVDVPTVDGTARVTVPPGVQSGVLLRLRGQGLPELHGEGRRGDLLVRVLVYTPQKLSPEIREALTHLREVEDPAPERMEDGKRGFWSRVKEAFSAG
ncbi:MAG TPA: molecular chaperone DnaJ [Longimicrobiales bacterium]|nr:molecular chaperone DnaJ [Longimicrobiales bacterium]